MYDVNLDFYVKTFHQHVESKTIDFEGLAKLSNKVDVNITYTQYFCT